LYPIVRRWTIKKEPRLYVGIDFSKHDTHFAVHQADGRALERHRRFANNQTGYEQAKAWLLPLLREQAAGSVALAGEATSYYWLPLYLQLVQDPDWAPYALEAYLLNARWVKWFKKSRSPNHKDDQIDPGEIAEYIRLQPPRSPWQYDAHWLPLRFATRLRAHLVKSRTREKNLFDLYLFLAYSSYTLHRPFANRLGKTSQSLLADAEQLEQLAALPLEQLTERLSALSQQRLPDPRRTAQRLQQVLQDRFPLPEPLAAPIQQGLALLLITIQNLQAQIQQVEGWIAAQLQENYPQVAWLDSVPGVGPVLASGIAAEIGDLTRFTDETIWDTRRQRDRKRTSAEVVDAVSKYAGLWWPKNASGQFEAEERRLSREGNAYLRYYVLEAADEMRRSIPSFHTYYQAKFDQATKHKHKRALVLTGCKALELFVTLLRRQEPYRAKEGDQPLLKAH
jgi:transposase